VKWAATLTSIGVLWTVVGIGLSSLPLVGLGVGTMVAGGYVAWKVEQ
jgi:hypothetical protein